MNPTPEPRPAEQTDRSVSRRSLLRGGTVLGVSALATAGLASAASAAPGVPTGRTRPRSASSPNLVLDYRASQPTGWSPTGQQNPGAVGATIGGHTSSLDFSYNDQNYRIRLLSFGPSGDAADPIYENIPTDPTVNFAETLSDAFGAYYSFDYAGGFQGSRELNVQSYNVFVKQPTGGPLQALSYGAEIYFTYHADLRHGDPGRHDSLSFIQVVNWIPPTEEQQPMSFVDSAGRANPFYPTAGPTSIYGSQVVNFVDAPQTSVFGPGPDGNASLSTYPFTAEAFVAQETGIRDAAGKSIVKIFGGLKYGWQVQQV